MPMGKYSKELSHVVKWEYKVEGLKHGEQYYYGTQLFYAGESAMKLALKIAYEEPYHPDPDYGVLERVVVFRNDKLFWRECDDN